MLNGFSVFYAKVNEKDRVYVEFVGRMRQFKLLRQELSYTQVALVEPMFFQRLTKAFQIYNQNGL